MGRWLLRYSFPIGLPPIARRTFLWLTGAALVASPNPARGVPLSTTEGDINSWSERDRRIWTSSSPDKKVWAYVDKHSVVAGEGFDLMLSTGPQRATIIGYVEFFRIGYHDEADQKLVWKSSRLSVRHYPVSMSAAAIGPNWPPAIIDIDTSAWPSGIYSADFVEAATGIRDTRIVQIVVRPRRRGGAVLVKLSTNTYQAYNDWGGHSLYPSEDDEARGAIVSFDRPTAPAFFEYEFYIVHWLESFSQRAGFTVDYCTDFDFHRDPSFAEDYKLIISGAHDEYWSKEVFDVFERRIFTSGKNTIFLGGNTAYWQVRFADVNRPPDADDLGRQLVGFKSEVDPIARRRSKIDPSLLVTMRYRDGSRRPESMLIGVAYESWFSQIDTASRYAYTVANTDAPFFAGTGLKVGDFFANVVGYEWDNRDPQGDGRRLWDATRSRIAQLPEDRITVLFHGAPVDVHGQTGRAEAVWYVSPAGAQVFSAGSISWAWGLGKSGFVQPAFLRFNENLVRHFLT